MVLSITIGAKSGAARPTPGTRSPAPTGTENDIVIRSLRVPRTALGVLAGLALGVAGALMQGHTRNPLADPGLLGVTQGAAFAMVASIILLGASSLLAYIWFGLAGALVASVGVFALGMVGGRGGPTPVTLALAGTAVSAFLYALTSAIVLLDEQAMDVFRFWQAGSIAARGSDVVWQVLPFIAGRPAAGAGQRARPERALPRRGRRPRASARTSRSPAPSASPPITLLSGASVAACGVARLHRADRPAPGPPAVRPRPPLAAAVLRADRRRRCCCSPT